MSLRPYHGEQGRGSRCLVIVSQKIWPAGLIWVNSAKCRRAERGNGNESIVIKRGSSQHLTSLKRHACSVGTSRAFALLVIKLAASPPEQSIKNVALRSGGGQVSLSSLIFYRKSGKKTSLGLFLKCKWLSGISFEELHLTCFHLRRLPWGFALQLQKCVGWGGGTGEKGYPWISKNFLNVYWSDSHPAIFWRIYRCFLSVHLHHLRK